MNLIGFNGLIVLIFNLVHVHLCLICYDLYICICICTFAFFTQVHVDNMQARYMHVGIF